LPAPRVAPPDLSTLSLHDALPIWLVEAQEFEHLKFDYARFTPELIREFQSHADHVVSAADNQVVVHHAYLERRVVPLDIYLREKIGRAHVLTPVTSLSRMPSSA